MSVNNHVISRFSSSSGSFAMEDGFDEPLVAIASSVEADVAVTASSVEVGAAIRYPDCPDHVSDRAHQAFMDFGFVQPMAPKLPCPASKVSRSTGVFNLNKCN